MTGRLRVIAGAAAAGRGRIAMVLTILGMAAAGPASGHGTPPESPGALWLAWGFDPVVIALLVTSGLAYGIGLARIWRSGRGRGIREWEALAWWAGWLSLFVALVSPLDRLAESLFSAHMIQHEILMLVGAPLMVLGRPVIALTWAMPEAARRGLGRAARPAALTRTWHFITRPLSAWAIHATALWMWHAPALFQATLKSDFVHSLQHASFFGSALLFWWALIRSRRSFAGYGAAVLYVFTTALHSGLLGALLTFAPSPWYPAYVPRVAAWGLTPVEDQQIGGLVMWIPAGVVYLVAGLALMAGWLRESAPPAAARTAPAVIAALVSLALLLGTAGCGGKQAGEAQAMTGGVVDRGRTAILRYGCSTCHLIPGVPGARGNVGPPLTGIARRTYLGGVVLNTPENMMRWIQRPRSIDTLSAMPNLGVTGQDARDIAAYLYTLK